MKKKDINILVVDDEEVVRKSICEALMRSGYTAVDAANSEEAISLSKLKPLSGAIIDCMLPKINGVDLAKDLVNRLPKDSPVTLMSGIYRDKTFATESIQKTGAKNFLEKPLDVIGYTHFLDSVFESLIDQPKVALHALLANPHSSNRERRKAFDHIEEMRGYDIPFVLSVLINAEASGHLNLYDEQGSIYGLTIVNGVLCSVDSEDGKKIEEKIVLDRGLLSSIELADFKSNNKSEKLIQGLVTSNYLSPHISSDIEKDFMIKTLATLIDHRVLKINFSPDRNAKMTSSHCEVKDLLGLFNRAVHRTIPIKFLNKFYEEWMEYPIQVGPNFSELDAMRGLSCFEKSQDFLDSLKTQNRALSEILLADDDMYNESIMRTVHLLAMKRVIIFSDTKLEAGQGRFDQLNIMWEKIKSLNPVETFEFYGLDSSVKVKDVQRVFRDLAMSYHPDLLDSSSSESIKNINHKIFAHLTSAHDVLTDLKKRAKYYESEQQKDVQKQLESEKHIMSGSSLMEQKQYHEALVEFENARSVEDSELSKLCVVWGLLKVHGGYSPDEVKKHIEPLFYQIDSKSFKQNTRYFYIKGLLFKQLKNIDSAAESFSKALDLDPNFLEARRELSTLKSSKKDNIDFTGELTGLISNFFKRKG